MVGAFLALLSAASFGLNNAVTRRGVVTGSVAQSMAISVPLGMLMFTVAVPIFSAWAALLSFSTGSCLLLAGAGIVHFVGNRYCTTRATKAMGGNLTAPFQQVSLLWTLALAVILLGERLTLFKTAGIALILIGPFILLRKGKPKRIAQEAMNGIEPSMVDAAQFVPDYREGYAFATLSALCSGTSPIMIRMAMPESAGIAIGVAGATISYIAATLVIAAILALPGRFAHVRSTTPRNTMLFLTSGVLVNLSQMFRYMALAIAPVSVVTPVQRTAVVFRLGFARLINPEHEVFTPWVLLASFVSLAGALLLVLSI